MTGRCECGRIRYRVKGEIKNFSHCHCGQCRRSHGAAFASFVGVASGNFVYLSGESELRTYASSSEQERIFCGICGSNLLAKPKGSDSVYVALGTVEGDPELPKAFHIFVGSKAPWHIIDDGLACYDTLPEAQSFS